MNSGILEWTKLLGSTIVSWPMAVLIVTFIFRRSLVNILQRFSRSEGSKAELGPIKIELGKLAQEGQQAVHNLNRINLVMAESRLLELEITEKTFGPMFTSEQRERMNRHIQQLTQLTREDSLDARMEIQ